MLEILLLIFFWRSEAKRIGAIAESRGREGGPYKVLLVALWIGGEIAGAVMGATTVRGSDQASVYILALLGAAVGAGIAFAIASNLTSLKLGFDMGGILAEASSQATISPRDPDEVICSNCKFEQWKGYTQCQKCGAAFR